MSLECTEEIWKPIPGYEGRYEVSSVGRVRSLPRAVTRPKHGIVHIKGGVLNPWDAGQGYLCVALSNGPTQKRWAVHQLVCIAFHGPRPQGKLAAHEDGVRDNNHASNLSWKTADENEKDKLRHGTRVRGEQHCDAKLTAETVRVIRESLRSKSGSIHGMARRFGVTRSTIRDAAYGATWACVTDPAPLLDMAGSKPKAIRHANDLRAKLNRQQLGATA